jgi:uncharacterized protein YrrD
VSRLVRATELMGLPVVALDTADPVGEVRDVLVDPARSKVVAFTVRGRGLFSPPLLGLLPRKAVKSIGEEALTIKTASDLVRERDGMASALDDQVEVLGQDVVTDGGGIVGEVVDVVLEVEGKEAVIVGAEIETPTEARVIVPLPQGATLGSPALIVPAATRRQTANGLAGFRALLTRARASRA